jgi:hypothetical protein
MYGVLYIYIYKRVRCLFSRSPTGYGQPANYNETGLYRDGAGTFSKGEITSNRITVPTRTARGDTDKFIERL